MIKYVKYQNKTTGQKTSGKWYVRAVIEQTIDLDALAEHMSNHNTPFSKGTIKGILTDAVSCMKELMLDGKAVKLADLAIFKLGLISKGVATMEEANASLVTGVRFNSMGTGEMAVTSLKDDIELKELTHYDPSTTTDGGTDPTTGEDTGGSSSSTSGTSSSGGTGGSTDSGSSDSGDGNSGLGTNDVE